MSETSTNTEVPALPQRTPMTVTFDGMVISPTRPEGEWEIEPLTPEPLHPPLYAGLVSELDVDPHFAAFTRVVTA